MPELAALLKGLHVSLVLISGALFGLRGLIALLRQHWAQARWLRHLAMVVDTALLLAGVVLLMILPLNPFTTPWLLSKLALLILYIMLGHQALNRPHSRWQRLGYYLAALLCFLAMLSVAQHHHPLGFLRFLL